MVRPDYTRFVIRDNSKLAIFYSYKICKQCKWTYLSNLHLSFNIRVIRSLVERFFYEIRGRESSWIVWPHHKTSLKLHERIALSQFAVDFSLTRMSKWVIGNQEWQISRKLSFKIINRIFGIQRANISLRFTVLFAMHFCGWSKLLRFFPWASY